MLGLLTTVATVVPVGVAVEADDLTPRGVRARRLRGEHCWRADGHSNGLEQGLGLRYVRDGGSRLRRSGVVIAASVVTAALGCVVVVVAAVVARGRGLRG